MLRSARKIMATAKTTTQKSSQKTPAKAAEKPSKAKKTEKTKAKTATKAKAKTAAKSAPKKANAGRAASGDSSLIVVESPAKARTIKKYLGADFEVLASVGHVKDLPKSKMGVDIENAFAPEYVPIRGKGKVIAEIKKA